MTDYYYIAEQAFNKARSPGSMFWLEHPQEGRDFFAAFARAIEDDYNTPQDTWCPDCDEFRDEIRDHENAYDDLQQLIDDAMDVLRRAGQR